MSSDPNKNHGRAARATSMNFKTTVILLILLVAAGVAVYFTRDKGTPSDTTTTEANKTLLTFSAGEVDRISITPADGKPIVMKPEGPNWGIVEPANRPAGR